MDLHFQTLFELEVVHDYLAGDVCTDLKFLAPPGGSSGSAAGGLLARVHHGRLQMLFEADASGRPLRPVTGTTVQIGLQLSRPTLTHVTQAPVADGVKPYYANASQAGAIDPPLPTIQLQGFQRLIPDRAERPLSVRWLNLNASAPLIMEESRLNPGETEAVFSTRNWPAGLYRLESTTEGQTQTSYWLKTPPWVGDDWWGMVAVTIDETFYSSAPTLRVSLQARRETLKYYVVAQNFSPGEFSQLQVVDAGAGEQNRAPLSFDRIASDHFSADEDFPPHSLNEDPSVVVLFQSQAPVARRAEGYRKLQLRRDSEILVQHLPQAGIDRAQARFIVHLAKS